MKSSWRERASDREKALEGESLSGGKEQSLFAKKFEWEKMSFFKINNRGKMLVF